MKTAMKTFFHPGLLLFTAFFVLAGSTLPHAVAAERRPNILIILADDMGYAEMGCQGNKDVPTPNIDSLAKNGVRFTNGYVSCPICAPTRAGLMTGRYQQRFGFETNPGPEAYADEKFGLPRSETTLAERLKAAGYVTGMFGKWHLGYQPDLQPTARGFDEFFGFLSGANNYLPNTRRGAARNPILRGTQTVEEKEYLTDAFGREAVAFIEKHREKPFFVYLPFNAVHSPLEASEKYTEAIPCDPATRNAARSPPCLPRWTTTSAACSRRCANIELEERTLIFFLSDNGGPTPQTTSSNVPLRGYKGQVLEGGIREPFIIQWKGHLPAGKVDDRPVIALDIHPTALAAAGAAGLARLETRRRQPAALPDRRRRPACRTTRSTGGSTTSTPSAAATGNSSRHAPIQSRSSTTSPKTSARRPISPTRNPPSSRNSTTPGPRGTRS